MEEVFSEQLNLEHGNEIKAWEQQRGEESLAFYYFQAYLQQGPTRTIKNISLVIQKENPDLPIDIDKLCARYFRSNCWAYRAELWDRNEFAQITRQQSEQRRKEMRISIEEYQKVQHQMSKGLASLASKVLTRVHKAIDILPESDWTLDRASRFMATLNATATTASGLWNESLGVGKLLGALEEMDALAAENQAAYLAQQCPPKVKRMITTIQNQAKAEAETETPTEIEVITPSPNA